MVKQDHLLLRGNGNSNGFSAGAAVLGFAGGVCSVCTLTAHRFLWPWPLGITFFHTKTDHCSSQGFLAALVGLLLSAGVVCVCI